MAEPAMAAGGEATPDSNASDVDAILALHGGDARETIAALLADVNYLRSEIAFASLAMSYGFARGWRPSLESRSQS